MAIRTLIFFCLVFLGTVMLSGQPVENPVVTLRQLTDSISRSEGEEAKVEGLLRQAEIYFDQLYELDKADSVFGEAMRWAESTNRTDLKLLVYFRFLQNLELGRGGPMVEETIEKLSELAKKDLDIETRFEVYETLCMACSSMGQACSESFAERASLLAGDQSDKLMRIRALLLNGHCLASELKIELAFSYYARAELAALELEKSDRREANQRIWESFASFYALLGEYDRALAYNEQLRLDNESGPKVDSTRGQWLLSDELEYLYNKDHGFPLSKRIRTIIEYASRKHLRRLKENALSLLRASLIDNEKYKEIRSLYVDEYPGELEVLHRRSPYHYLTVRSFIHEADGEPDSAMTYWRAAIMEAEAMPNPFQVAHARYRFGQFCRRHGNYKEATTQWEKAYNIASQYGHVGYRNELHRDLAAHLEQAYLEKGNHEQAHRYAGILHRHEIEDINLQSQSFFTLQGQHQSALEARKAELADYEEKRRHNLQYWIISFLLVILITSLILASSMRVPRWIVEMLAFFSVLAIVEFVLLLLDKQVVYVTGGNPLGKFFIKVAILSIVFPLHHIVEHRVKEYMLKHKLIGRIRGRDVRGAMASLWPWLRDDQKEDN